MEMKTIDLRFGVCFASGSLLILLQQRMGSLWNVSWLSVLSTRQQDVNRVVNVIEFRSAAAHCRRLGCKPNNLDLWEVTFFRRLLSIFVVRTCCVGRQIKQWTVMKRGTRIEKMQKEQNRCFCVVCSGFASWQTSSLLLFYIRYLFGQLFQKSIRPSLRQHRVAIAKLGRNVESATHATRTRSKTCFIFRWGP